MPQPPGGTGRPLVWAAVTIAALAAFAFWLNFPQPHFVPAPLDPVGPDCPRSSRAFIPTNATEVPDLPSSGLSRNEKKKTTLRVNMEACPCGCQLSLAACRINYPACTRSAEQIKKVVAESSAKEPSK